MRVQNILSYVIAHPTKAIFVLVIVGILVPVGETVTSAVTRRRVLRGQWHSPNWLGEFQRRPGCYVIVIYNDNGVMENLYVGQSVDVRRRIKEHITGHGNKRVYQDVLLQRETAQPAGEKADPGVPGQKIIQHTERRSKETVAAPCGRLDGRSVRVVATHESLH